MNRKINLLIAILVLLFLSTESFAQSGDIEWDDGVGSQADEITSTDYPNVTITNPSDIVLPLAKTDNVQVTMSRSITGSAALYTGSTLSPTNIYSAIQTGSIGGEDGIIGFGFDANGSSPTTDLDDCSRFHTITFSFNPPVEAPNFSILDIDTGTSDSPPDNWNDVVKISALDNNSNPVTPTVSLTGSTISGPVTTSVPPSLYCEDNDADIGCSTSTPCYRGTTNAPATGDPDDVNDGTMGVSFPGSFISEITINYYAGNEGDDEDPNNQFIAIGDIAWSDTLPITLSSFSSSYEGNGVKLEWTTGMEVMNVGFNIYGYIDGERIEINEEIIPSKRPDSLEPQYYEEIISVSDKVEQLGISSVDTRGKVDYFGPFEIGASYGEELEVEKVDWARVKEEFNQKMVSKGFENRSGVMRSSANSDSSYVSKLVRTAARGFSSAVCNVAVSEEGMYRVSYEELSEEGCDFNGKIINQIAVTYKGKKISRYIHKVRGNKFGPGSYIDFYGELPEGDDVLYTAENIYQISLNGRKASNVKKLGGSKHNPEEEYIEQIEINKNIFHSLNIPYRVNGDKDPWYENSLSANPSVNAVSTHSIVVNEDIDTTKPGLLKVNLIGISQHGGEIPDHEVIIRLNERDLGTYTNDGVVNWVIEIPTAPGFIVPNTNTLEIDVTGATGFDFDLIFVNSYELQYTRPTEVRANKLRFNGNSRSGYRVSGFTESGVEVYGNKNGKLTKIVPVVEDESTIAFKGIRGEVNYWVGTANTINKGSIYPSDINNNIIKGNADVIVLTHTVFEGAELDSYVNSIENRGHSVKVVNVQDVYEKYGYGMPTPNAITKYLKKAKKKVGNDYVVIVGATTTNPPGNEDTINFVPTKYEFTQGIIFYTPSDGSMMDFNGDYVPEVAVSRLPVRLGIELSTFVNKIEKYTAKPSALLVAEHPSGGLSFANQLDQIEQNTFGDSYSVSKVYLNDASELEDKKQDMIDIINLDEVGLIMMDGHANPFSFMFEGLMTASDAGKLRNSNSAVFLPLACFLTYYPSSGVNTLAHQLLFNPGGGSVSISGAITFSGFNTNRVFAEAIVKKMLEGKTLGRAVKETKEENPELRDQLINWETLGDMFTTLPQADLPVVETASVEDSNTDEGDGFEEDLDQDTLNFDTESNISSD